MRRCLHFLACFGWEAAWWLAWFLLFGVCLSLLEKPLWLALPAGLLAGAVRNILPGREESGAEQTAKPDPFEKEAACGDAVKTLLRRMTEKPAAPRFFPGRAKKTLWCLSIGRDAESLPLPARETRTERAVLRHAALPFAWRRRDDAVWKEFLRALPLVKREQRALGAVILHLDARRIAERDEETLLKKARFLRSRLDELADAADAAPAVLLLVDGIDRLYGWASLAALLPEERLGQPLGAFPGDGNGGKTTDDLVDAVSAEAARLVCSPSAFSSPPSPARLQALPEFLRVADRLRLFAKHLGGGDGERVRGVFFGSFLPGLSPLPPFAAEPSFPPAEEPPFRRRSLFLDSFFTGVLPEAAGRRAGGGASRPRGAALHAGVAALLVAALGAGWLLTWSFLRTRNILLSASGAAAFPETPGQLAGYLRLAEETTARSGEGTPPRFGMTEDRALARALRQRFSESYYDLKTIPGIERLQNAALEAARSGKPREMGNALLMLLLTRDEIASATGLPALPEENRLFLREIAVSLGLTSRDELRQLRAFLDWAGEKDWMPEVMRALERFARHIARAEPDGGWVAAWVDSVPLFPGAALPNSGPGAFRPLAREGAIAPAWTWRGYAAAKALAEALPPGSEEDGAAAAWRERALEGYRTKALAAWRGAAATLWDGAAESMPDDPAGAFAALAAEHLLPMYDDAGGGAAAPEIAWLRLRGQLEARAAAGALSAFGAGRVGSVPLETGAALLVAFRRALSDAAVSGGKPESLARHFLAWETRGETLLDPGDPVAEASRLAGDLDALLNRHAGAACWPALSPLATERFSRRLLARRAAVQLDALWRRTVYTPCRFTPGGAAARQDRLAGAGGLLEGFLTGAANGFWIWRGEAVRNADWNGVPFGFSGEFLDFCNSVLENARLPVLEELPLTLRVASVDVAGRAVVERPTAVEFLLGPEESGQAVTYRNYPVAGKWVWKRGVAGARLRVVFPSHTAEIAFSGDGGVRAFFRLFGEGGCRLEAEAFGESAERLRRLGVESVTIHAGLREHAALSEQLSRKEQLPVPESILSR